MYIKFCYKRRGAHTLKIFTVCIATPFTKQNTNLSLSNLDKEFMNFSTFGPRQIWTRSLLVFSKFLEDFPSNCTQQFIIVVNVVNGAIVATFGYLPDRWVAPLWSLGVWRSSKRHTSRRFGFRNTTGVAWAWVVLGARPGHAWLVYCITSVVQSHITTFLPVLLFFSPAVKYLWLNVSLLWPNWMLSWILYLK